MVAINGAFRKIPEAYNKNIIYGGSIMLVSAKEMLQKAKAGHYAVGQFNINNLEWTKAILATAQ